MGAKKRIIWFGVEIDFKENTYVTTDTRIESISHILANILSPSYTTARRLSKSAGSIVSTKFVLGDLIHLKTRYFFSAIEKRISWDTKLLNIKKYAG